MTEDTLPTPELVGLIRFHGMNMWTVSHSGTDYILAKPLAEVAGLDWRSAKKAVLNGDNAILYGSREMRTPRMAGMGGVNTTQVGVYIRLDRSRMFLARIQTGQMRALGKVDAANALLDLQIEWAGVLHKYEAEGYAIKTEVSEARRKSEATLAALFKVRGSASDATEQGALTRMIHDKLADLGYPIDPADEPQGALPLQ